MSLESLLFFSDASTGDLLGFPITKQPQNARQLAGGMNAVSGLL
jgi:hypothetical protein